MIKRARALLGLACFIVITVLLVGLLGKPLIPYRNGGVEFQKSQTLLSLTEKGLWSQVFGSVREARLTPQTIVGAFLPNSAFGLGFYAFVLLTSTYLLFAYGIWRLCSTIQRPQWATPLFLLSAANHASFDYPNQLDDSMQGAGIILIALALFWEWKAETGNAKGITSGALLGLSYWISPLEGFQASVVLSIGEILSSFIWGDKFGIQRYREPLASFLLIAIPAMLLGAGYEIFESLTHMLFIIDPAPSYPASLVWLYNVGMLFVFGIVLFTGVKVFLPEEHKKVLSIPGQSSTIFEQPAFKACVSIIIISILLGVLDCLIGQKDVKSWIFILPAWWILFLAALEYITFRAASITAYSLCWLILISSQVLTGWHQSYYIMSSDNKPEKDSFDQFPLGWSSYQNTNLLQAAAATIHEGLPSGQIIMGTDDVSLNDFRLQYALNERYATGYTVNALETSDRIETPFGPISSGYDNRVFIGAQAIVIFNQLGAADLSNNGERLSALADWLDVAQAKPGQANVAHIILAGRDSGTIYFLCRPFSLQDFQDLEDFWEKRPPPQHR